MELGFPSGFWRIDFDKVREHGTKWTQARSRGGILATNAELDLNKEEKATKEMIFM